MVRSASQAFDAESINTSMRTIKNYYSTERSCAVVRFHSASAALQAVKQLTVSGHAMDTDSHHKALHSLYEKKYLPASGCKVAALLTTYYLLLTTYYLLLTTYYLLLTAYYLLLNPEFLPYW